MNLKKGAKNVFYSLAGQIITLVVGVFIPRLVILSYGSEVNGLLSSIGTIISYLALLEAGIGTLTCQQLYNPIAKDDKNRINTILSTTNYYYKKIGTLYLIGIVGIAFIYPLVVNVESLSYLQVVIIIILTGAPSPIAYFCQRKLQNYMEAVGDNYLLSNISTTLSLTMSLLKILLLNLGFDVIVVQSTHLAIVLVQVVIIYIVFKKKYPWVSFKQEKDFSGFKQKGGTIVHSFCALVTNSTDVLLLTFFCPLYVVSIYGIYKMIFNIVYNSINTINGNLTFLLGNAYQKGRDYYKKTIDAYETVYVTLTGALMFATCFLCPSFIEIYTAGADVNYSNIWFPILFMAVNFTNATRNASFNTISISGHFNDTAKYAITESIINIVISVVGVIYLGMVGVLIGTVVAFVYRMFVAYNFVSKKILFMSAWHSYKTMIVNTLLISGLTVLGLFFPFEINNLLVWFAVAIPVTTASLILFITTNAIFDRQSFNIVWGVIKRKFFKKKKIIINMESADTNNQNEFVKEESGD